MHHRPQLQTKIEMGLPEWRRHLDICVDSAIKMCRLQEALLRDFGLHGLNFMLRGINFTVYCVLTCTMLHLVSHSIISSEVPKLTIIGCHHMSRSSAQLTSSAVLHETYACS
jgi:hypothetical protein